MIEYIFISINVFLDVFLEIIDSCRGLTGVGSRFCDLTEYASCINNGFYKWMFIYCRHFHVIAKGYIWTKRISIIGCPDVGVLVQLSWRPLSVPGAIRCPPGRAPFPPPSFKTSSAGMSLFPPPPSGVAGPLDD